MVIVIHRHESAMDIHVFPHPDPASHHPLHPIPLGLPSVPGLSTCLMHPTWAGDLKLYVSDSTISIQEPCQLFEHANFLKLISMIWFNAVILEFCACKFLITLNIFFSVGKTNLFLI